MRQRLVAAAQAPDSKRLRRQELEIGVACAAHAGEVRHQPLGAAKIAVAQHAQHAGRSELVEPALLVGEAVFHLGTVHCQHVAGGALEPVIARRLGAVGDVENPQVIRLRGLGILDHNNFAQCQIFPVGAAEFRLGYVAANNSSQFHHTLRSSTSW